LGEQPVADEQSLKDLPPNERLQRLLQAKNLAQSEALRELLPRDEASEKLIGPSGGYEDKTTASQPEE